MSMRPRFMPVTKSLPLGEDHNRRPVFQQRRVPLRGVEPERHSGLRDHIDPLFQLVGVRMTKTGGSLRNSTANLHRIRISIRSVPLRHSPSISRASTPRKG
jgi:hypothetical protein